MAYIEDSILNQSTYIPNWLQSNGFNGTGMQLGGSYAPKQFYTSNASTLAGRNLTIPNNSGNALTNAWDGIRNWWNGGGTTTTLADGSTVTKGTNGEMLGNIGGLAMGAYGIYSGLQDMRKNNRLYKEQMENMQLQRDAFKENMARDRAEYNRLKGQRAALTAAYGA